MSTLIQTNPSEVLRVALPTEVFAKMPASVQALVEQRVQLQGALEVLIEEGYSGAKLHHYLKFNAGRLELKFADKTPTNLLTGARVVVTGVQVGNVLALTSNSTGSSGMQVLSSGLTNTFGAQPTLVMLVNFQDNTNQPFSIADVMSAVFGSGSSATNWDLENSLQQTWLTGTVIGWYTLPLTEASCPDTDVISSDANAAATAAGIDLTAYTHYMYAFPLINTCYGWAGLATVGGNPGYSWINGTPTVKLTTHEMGHNLGLWHAHSSTCGSTLTLCTTPTINEYGDPIDTMGNPSSGQFNAFQKERLGWLNYGTSPPITLVQSNGTYTIGPYENQDSTPKALKILQSTDPTTLAKSWYYVQYNQAVGFDTFLSSNPNVLGGVLVHTGTVGDGNSNYLLNLAPSLNNIAYAALDVGQTFIDPTAGVTMQTVSAGPSGASVSVTFGTPACQHFNPTLTLSPSQSENVPPGTPVTYTISLLNNDNAGCSASTFNLSSALPSGWTASFGSPNLSLAYGNSASTTVLVVSPNTAPTGTYSFSVAATNAAATTFTVSAGATYNLNTTPCAHVNPSVTFSPLNWTAQPGTTAMYVLGVTNNDNASCNSSTFTLGDAVPSGWTGTVGVSTLTIAPGASGSTSLQVTSSSGAAPATYAIGGSATSTISGSYTGSGSANYIIPSPNCTAANPTVTMSPSQSQSVAPGTPVSFTVSVKDNDRTGCPGVTFNMSAQLSSGWSGTWSNTALALSPGASSSPTITATSPANAATGSYGVLTRATNAANITYSGSAIASYVLVVGTPPAPSTSVSISTNSSSYSAGQNVSISVKVASGGKAVSGAKVTVAITTPSGSVVTLSGTTGKTGSASLTYKLPRSGASGSYTAKASTASGGSTVTASTTFAVK